MEGVFSWLSALMEWFGRWIPRLEIVTADEAGVKFQHGSRVVAFGPGLVWYWPMTTKLRSTIVVRQVLNLTTQTLTTRDGRTVMASGIVVYRVSDIVRYLVENHDADRSLENVSLGAIRRIVVRHEFDALQQGQEQLDAELADALREHAEDYGVDVLDVRLSDFALVRALSVSGINLSSSAHTVQIEAA